MIESYGKSDTAVIVYEVSEPYYVIAASTGSPSSNLMLSSDLRQPCPVNRGEQTGCEPVRIAIADFGNGDPMDPVLVKAAARHEDEGYPRDLLSIKISSDVSTPVYVSQSTTYTQEGTDLSWRVVVVEPGVESTTDALLKGDTMFAVVCVIGALGCIICALFAGAMYRRRAEKAIVFADWRFTCAFIVGCIFFNASTFTLLGENTKTTCLLRMWTFHFFFVAALSPLFVKVWRMYKLVGSRNIRRNAISNFKAAIYTLPMIVIQVTLLLIFTFVDPPRPTEYVNQDGGEVVHGVVCDTDTNAPFITLGAYEFSFVFVGCVLAYLTRNMQDDFGEAKQMIFSMYNIFFVGLIMVLVVQVIGLEGNEASIMQAVGVFWGTVFSTGAFVIPRLLQAREVRRDRREGNTTNVHVSGINVSGASVDSTGKSRDSMFDSNNRASSLDVIDEDENEDIVSSEILGPVRNSVKDTPNNNIKLTEDDTEQAPEHQASKTRRLDFAGELSDQSSSTTNGV